MIPHEAAGPIDAYVEALDRVAPDHLAGVYLVGGLALADFSLRQSNLDLVVVCDPPLTPAELSRLKKAEAHLERAGRPAGVWHAGWDDIATPSEPATAPRLDAPLTRALLCEEAIPHFGPDWPVVAYDEGEYREWCRRELELLAAADHGLMVMRNGVAPLVLQAARLAQGAATGRVFSKSEAGNTALSLVPYHFRRILHDAAGFRNGAHTSMYWGPFERKYDARQLLRQLLKAIHAEA